MRKIASNFSFDNDNILIPILFSFETNFTSFRHNSIIYRDLKPENLGFVSAESCTLAFDVVYESKHFFFSK